MDPILPLLPVLPILSLLDTTSWEYEYVMDQ